MIPWFLILFQRLNTCGCVKPGSEDQRVSGDLSNLRVASLEGVRSLRSFNACSDKKSLPCSFEPKRKSSAVRMLARCAHPTATFVAAPTNTLTSFTIFAGTQNDESRQRRHSLLARHSFGRHQTLERKMRLAGVEALVLSSLKSLHCQQRPTPPIVPKGLSIALPTARAPP
jgi:hypothetical protein